jgi:hypothetical protein
MFRWIKSRREALIRQYARGYAKGRERMEREKDAEIKMLKREYNEIIAQKNKEIKARDVRVKQIDQSLSEFIEIFAYAKHLSNMIESRESTKYARITEEYQETTGFAGRLRRECLRFERKSPALQSKIEKYKIEAV